MLFGCRPWCNIYHAWYSALNLLLKLLIVTEVAYVSFIFTNYFFVHIKSKILHYFPVLNFQWLLKHAKHAEINESFVIFNYLFRWALYLLAESHYIGPDKIKSIVSGSFHLNAMLYLKATNPKTKQTNKKNLMKGTYKYLNFHIYFSKILFFIVIICAFFLINQSLRCSCHMHMHYRPVSWKKHCQPIKTYRKIFKGI